MPNQRVLIITGPQGHYSIAKSLEQTLSPHYPTKLLSVNEPFMSLYTPFYRLFPWAFKFPFLLSQIPGLLELAQSFNRFRYHRQLLEVIDREDPTTVISTYFMFHPSLSAICQIKNINLFTPFTDPWSIHPLLIEKKATQNLVFDERSLSQAIKIQTQANYAVTGWFVRHEYEQSYDQKLIRQQLGLESNLFTILIASGSEGSATVMKILPRLISLAKPVQIIVACGTNQKMLNRVNKLQQSIPASSKTVLKALPFEPNLYLYMQAADLVVGKAGPNTVFETAATNTPFFAITHISGQEDGNLDIIKHYQLGYVEENISKATSLLQAIIENPETLKQFSEPITRLAAYNKNSKTKLLSLVSQTHQPQSDRT